MNELSEWGTAAVRAERALLLAESPGFGRLFMFLCGALGYGLLEVFWRGYTHWSMLVAGGICLLAIDHLDRTGVGLSDMGKAFCSALLITAVELVFGVVFNVYLGQQVWDYSALPYNFFGQICLPFFLIWLVLAYGVIKAVRWLRRAY